MNCHLLIETILQVKDSYIVLSAVYLTECPHQEKLYTGKLRSDDHQEISVHMMYRAQSYIAQVASLIQLKLMQVTTVCADHVHMQPFILAGRNFH